jgi:glycogen synthase
MVADAAEGYFQIIAIPRAPEYCKNVERIKIAAHELVEIGLAPALFGMGDAYMEESNTKKVHKYYTNVE